MPNLWSLIVGMNSTVAAALIAGVVSVVVSGAVSRRSSYIVAVTTQRSAWIDKLRGNIADLLGACAAIQLGMYDTKPEEARAQRGNVDRLIALITMQLNPDNEIDANMIGLLALFPKRAESEKEKYRELEHAFVRHAQFLLKAEWEKVKFEAMGWPSKIAWYRKRCERERNYNDFCTRTESLVDKIAAM